MSQVISNFPSGSYSFSFTASQRDIVGRDNTTNQTVTVLVDGASVGSFTPADTNWYSFQTTPIVLNQGDHTLTFTNIPVPGDAMILIDNVGIQQGTNSSTNVTAGSNPNIISAFSPIATQTYGTSFTFTPPTASSGLPVSISVLSGPATISGNTVTLTGAGTVILAADQAGNANYSPATEVTTSFTVLPADQTIAPFIEISPQVNGTSFTVTPPIASSGLPVSLSVLSGPATVTNGLFATPVSKRRSSAIIGGGGIINLPPIVFGLPLITLTGTGTVVLAADQAGNTNYNAASEVTTSFVVKSFAQNITPFDFIPNKTFGDPSFRIKLPTASSGLFVPVTVQSGPATISGNLVTLIGAGTVTLAADQAGNTNFTAAPEATTSFSVAQANQRINFPGIPDTKFTSVPIQLKAIASSGLPVTYTNSGPAVVSGGNLLTLSGAGTVTVIAFQTGSTNYNAAISVTNSFSVGRVSQIITFPEVNQQSYAGASNSFTIVPPTASSGLPVQVNVKSGPATILGNTVTLTGTGRVVLSATQGGDGNYLPAREALINFTVKTFSQSIAPFALIPNQTLGSKPFKITPPISSSGLKVKVTVKSGPARIEGNKIHLTGIGTVILAANQEGNAKYAPADEVTTSFQVTAATLNPFGQN